MAAGDELRVALERGDARLKELVLKQPPLDLLTYLRSQLQMGAMLKSDDAPAAGVLPNEFTLADEDEVTCGCGRSWVTLVEEQDGPQGARCEAVHLVAVTKEDPCIPVDRRRLR
jgi:hypothetical protein